MYDHRFSPLRGSLQPRPLGQPPVWRTTSRWQPLSRPYETVDLVSEEELEQRTEFTPAAEVAHVTVRQPFVTQLLDTVQRISAQLPRVQIGSQGKIGMRWMLIVAGVLLTVVVIAGGMMVFRYARVWLAQQEMPETSTPWMINNVETFTLPTDAPVLTEASAGAVVDDSASENAVTAKGGEIVPSPVPSPLPTSVPAVSSTPPERWEEHQFVTERFSLFTPPDYRGASVRDVPTSVVTISLKPAGAAEEFVSLRIQPDWSGTNASASTARTYPITTNIAAIKQDVSPTLLQPSQAVTQYIFPHAGRVFVISCAHHQDAQRLTVCEQIVQSFRPW